MSPPSENLAIPVDWTFKNRGVAQGFDQHVRQQLPWYELATGAVIHFARHFIPDGGLVYDLGASTGNIGRALESTLQARGARLIGVEPSKEMAAIYQAPGELLVQSAATTTYEPFDVAICFLVLMFLSVEERATLMRELAGKVRAGGALLIVDKSQPRGRGYLPVINARLALAGKLAQGVPAEEILQKELSISGVQRPLGADELALLVDLGLHQTEFFRFGDFSGWVFTR